MKHSVQKELMDLPGNAPAVLAKDLGNLRLINRYLGGYRCIRKGVEKILCSPKKGGEISFLDLGTGSADIPVALVRWARARGVVAKVVALEADPVTASIASGRTRHLREISIVQGDASRPPFPPASFDCVLASQLLHHFREERIVGLLKIWSQLARQAIIIGDLVRHPVSYYGIQWLTWLCTRNLMTRTDAPLSVKRAFTLREWHELFQRAAVGNFQVRRVFPYRMMARIQLAD